MEQRQTVGLYLTRRQAMAVWLSEKEHGTIIAVLDIQPTEDASAQTAALQAARALRQRGILFDEAYVALDGGYYTQYNLHSEFTDSRQIESTIKYDTEDAAATDVMNLAVTFAVTGQVAAGSEVMAFSADRQTVTDILLDIQEGGLDPEMMEPDVMCLARALEQTLGISKHPDTLYVMAGEQNGYFIRPGSAEFAPTLRSFLLNGPDQRTAALTRELLLSTAAVDGTEPLRRVVFVQSPDGVDIETLAARTGIQIEVESAFEKLPWDAAPDTAASPQAILIAAGAAMAPMQRSLTADFRKDFMPYQGKRKIMEASLRLVCISLTVLFAALGLFFQSRTWRVNSYTDTLKTKMAEEYSAAMYGASPPGTEAITSRLRRTLANVRRVQEGLGPGDEQSVPARLTFLLEAINDAPESVDVIIQQIDITERTMRVRGDTNSRRATLDLFETVKNHPRLRFGQERMSMAGNRDTFEFTVEPTE